MGCSPSTERFEPAEFDRMWNNMNSSERHSEAGKVGKHRYLFYFLSQSKKLLFRTWKILRVNLISTFKDFRNERAHIHKMVLKVRF